jgi:hypothetical protein
VRCVEPTHLAVIRTAEHQAHHAEERRLEICPRHGTPYDLLTASGRVRCRKCGAEATARWRQRYPDYQLPAPTEEQRLRRTELIRLRRLTPESGAAARAREQAAGKRKAARRAA